eukprot:1440381-Prymnesium_polylepis.1
MLVASGGLDADKPGPPDVLDAPLQDAADDCDRARRRRQRSHAARDDRSDKVSQEVACVKALRHHEPHMNVRHDASANAVAAVLGRRSRAKQRRRVGKEEGTGRRAVQPGGFEGLAASMRKHATWHSTILPGSTRDARPSDGRRLALPS